MHTRRRRRGDLDLGKIFTLLVVLVVGYLAWAFVPAYYGQFTMRRTVQETILVWRDTASMAKSQKQLERNMDKNGVPSYVWPQDCEFYEKFDEKHLDCFWVVEIDYPLIDKSTEIEFAVHKYLDKGGLLHDALEEQ